MLREKTIPGGGSLLSVKTGDQRLQKIRWQLARVMISAAHDHFQKWPASCNANLRALAKPGTLHGKAPGKNLLALRRPVQPRWPSPRRPRCRVRRHRASVRGASRHATASRSRGTGRTDGMPKRAGTTIDVQLVSRNTKVLGGSHGYHGEGLVDFEQVNIANAPP